MVCVTSSHMAKKLKLSRRQRKQNRPQGKGRGSESNPSPPKPTFAVDRPRYNPTWNPQYLKVARTFQFSTTSGDLAGGYAKIVDPSVTCSTTVHSYASGAITFGIDNIPNVSEFGNLFDQYKIAAVNLKWEFMSATQSILSTTATLQQRFTLLLYEDYDDSTAPPTTNNGFAAVYESGRARRATFPNRTNSMSYTVRPKYLDVAVDYASGSAGRALASGWVDGATNSVIWYGLKWIAQANPAPVATVGTWRVTATYYTEWRNRQ